MTLSASLQFGEITLVRCVLAAPFPHRLLWRKCPVPGIRKKSLNGGMLIPYMGQMMS